MNKINSTLTVRQLKDSGHRFRDIVEAKQLRMEYYSPSGSMEWFEEETGNYYNRSGQLLRNPSEYEPDEDGCHTPFGDE